MNKTDHCVAPRPAHCHAAASINREGGQALVWALLALLVLSLAGAALLDVFIWTSTRTWAYHAAERAAERALTQAAVYDSAADGWGLDADLALAHAGQALAQELALRGIEPTTAMWDIRVHPSYAATTAPGYPPGGELWGLSGDWTTHKPSVAVYLELDAPIFLGRLSGLSAPARIHVFAASSFVW